MNKNNSINQEIESIYNKLDKTGVCFFTDSRKIKRASSCSNSYIFSTDEGNYILDPGFGKKRRKQIQRELKKFKNIDILCSHYHNDHSANMGKTGLKDTAIFCHYKMKNKIDYLRTNGTGQILVMAERMPLKGMLERFNMFPGWLLKNILFLSSVSKSFRKSFLFLVSYFYSLKSIGLIFNGKSKIRFLEKEDMEKIKLNNFSVKGWKIEENLIAIESPGHTDDHLIFYFKKKKILFAGDSLNFLNGNDIQFGDIEEVSKTLSFLLEFCEKEKPELLLQGHYFPVFGSEKIYEYILDIKNRHDHIFSEVSGSLAQLEAPFSFDCAFENLKKSPSELLTKVIKISFPRSTLIFLDVYLLKILASLGYEQNKDGLYFKKP